jgi:PleD family two-component response regulator
LQMQDQAVQRSQAPVMIDCDDMLNASILIVDDQEANVQLLEHMLNEAGYRNVMLTMDPHNVYMVPTPNASQSAAHRGRVARTARPG